MRSSHAPLLGLLALIGSAGPLSAAQSIPIHVTPPPGVAADALVPMYVGLPLPATPTAQSARLLDEAGGEVPLQAELLATWTKGGAARWVGLHFAGRTGGKYRVEFGDTPRPPAAPPQPLFIAENAHGITVDTGAAKFLMPKTGPLFSRMMLGSRPVLQGRDGEGCLLVADQHGTQADETRGDVSEAPRVEVRGPLFAVVCRDGLLRTADGRRLGAYRVRLEFYAGIAAVKVQHTFINTESSNSVQYSDIGLRIRPLTVPSAPREAAFDTPDGFAAALPAGESLSLLQSVFRHHGQKESRFDVSKRTPQSDWASIATGEEAGDWGAVTGDGVGIAMTIPHLARTFPKELEIGPDGFTAHLWSSRGGRMLDYRVASLVDYWGRKWIDDAYPDGAAAMRKIVTEAMSTARTHDVWIDLFDAPEGVATPAGRQRAAELGRSRSTPPLAVVDGRWLRSTEALGAVPAVDERRFPRIEHFLREFFREYVAGQADGWGDYGFLDYGCGPHNYGNPRADVRKDFPKLQRRYANHEYNYRTSVWMHYARTGDRAVFDYAAALNRHIADFKFSWFDSPNRTRGAMLGGKGSEENPFYWAGDDHAKDPSGMLGGHQGKDLENLLFQFYLTGDRHALDAVNHFGEVYLAKWDPTVLPNVGASSNNHMPLGFGAILYRHTWDERFREKAAQARARVIDVNTTTGLVDGAYYGAIEKWNTRLWATVKDYEAFGDPVTKQALKQACEFMILSPPRSDSGYQDHSGLYAWYGWRLTGDVRFARWMNERLERLAYEYLDPQGKLRYVSPVNGLAFGGATSTFNVTESLIYGMALVAEAEADTARVASVRRPWIALSSNLPGHPETEIWFVKDSHRRQRFDLLVDHGWDMENRKPVVSVPTQLWITNRGNRVGPVEIFERPGYYETGDPGLSSGWARLTLPADVVGGEYRLLKVPAVLEHDAKKLVLVARDGVALSGTRDKPPTWYFQVPAGKQGTIYVNKPATVVGPDGAKRSVSAEQPLSLRGGPRDAMYALHTNSLTFVRFGGEIPAVLAQDDPELYFIPSTDVLPSEFTPPPRNELFAVGLGDTPENRGLYLTDDRRLTIPLGTAAGGRVVDYRRGTIEFWVQPAWTTGGRSVPAGETSVQNLWIGGGGFWRLFYTDFAGDAPDVQTMSSLRFAAPGKPAPQDLRNITPFRAGRWHHVAVCWDTTPRGWISETYIDGSPSLGVSRLKTGLGRYNETAYKTKPDTRWTVVDPSGKELTFYGGIEGIVDEIRISNIPRYPEPFDPLAPRPFEADANTTLLLHLDGDGAAVGEQGKPLAPVELPKR
jgi:hypothetical protein